MKSCRVLIIILLFIPTTYIYSQQLHFTPVLKLIGQPVYRIAQDKYGLIWLLSARQNDHCILQQYNGSDLTTFKPDAQNPNSLQNFFPGCFFIDNENKKWIGLMGGGVDIFNSVTNEVTHFHHNQKDAFTISNDTVNAILEDHSGKMWIGTQSGLDLMDKATGKCSHFLLHNGRDKNSVNNVDVLYEDREGNLWVGFGNPFNVASKQPNVGGLYRFNLSSGTFTRYAYNTADSLTTIVNKVTSILEDNKGVLWIGTSQNHLYSINKSTGIITQYFYDPAHPENLSAPPQSNNVYPDLITNIKEDATGAIWICTNLDGFNRYDPSTKTCTHFGRYYISTESIVAPADTVHDYNEYNVSSAFIAKDGMLWLSTFFGFVYNVNPANLIIPFVQLHANGNAFFQDTINNVLWIGTNKGLIKKDINNNKEKIWQHEAGNKNGIQGDSISNIKYDNGILWMSIVGGGLCRFDLAKNAFTSYLNDTKDSTSISNNLARNLLIDHNKNIWVGTYNGLNLFNMTTNKFKRFFHDDNDSTSLLNNGDDYIFEDKSNTIWIGSFGGLDRLNKDGKTFYHYLKGLFVFSFYTDKKGIMWVGTSQGLYSYDAGNDKFIPFTDTGSEDHFTQITSMLGDDDDNLWLRTSNSLIKVNAGRTKVSMYGSNEGVHSNYLWMCRNVKGKNDELFIGDLDGYYDFFPRQIKNPNAPQIIVTGFKLGNADVLPSKQGLLKKTIYETTTLSLSHDQNNFSFSFIALHYNSPGDEKYLVMLQNYDHTWRNTGTEHYVSFYDVSPGKYVLRIRAFNNGGAWSEKDIAIIISPPWWKTWWAYTFFVLLFSGVIYSIIYYRNRLLSRRNKLLEIKVDERTKQLNKSLKELKSTQAQLIQSEKMASLGELTAGIAHEIQNPLNFVNNFSEVNNELIEELKSEKSKLKNEEQDELLNDIFKNNEKIAHHGRRADAIVKGMLQHSRQTKGVKEPTDINALCDEYLRLSYHGLRAKEKNFNANFKTDFDEGVGKINIVPQDIGRVLLNLFNNAFYATNEKYKTNAENYKPLVSVQTKKLNDKIEIRVTDNGGGIPASIKDKIFQPFFTTKPTGEGTGLGLSLAYDIITKEHNGSIKAESKEGEGSTFIIQLLL